MVYLPLTNLQKIFVREGKALRKDFSASHKVLLDHNLLSHS